MAKLVAPLQSFSASGRIVGNLTFSNRKSGQQVRWQKNQKDVITSLRTEQRNRFAVCIDAWKYWDYGIQEYGFQLYGGKDVHISSFPHGERAPKFACYVRDFLS